MFPEPLLAFGSDDEDDRRDVTMRYLCHENGGYDEPVTTALAHAGRSPRHEPKP